MIAVIEPFLWVFNLSLANYSLSLPARVTSTTPRETVPRGYTLQCIRRVLQGLWARVIADDDIAGRLQRSITFAMKVAAHNVSLDRRFLVIID